MTKKKTVNDASTMIPTYTYDEANKLCVTKNLKNLLEALQVLGVVTVTAEYSGSDDSGQIDEVYAKPDTVDVSKEQMFYYKTQYLEGDNQRHVVVRELISLQSAMSDIFYDALEEEHGGWENNDGADGTMVFDVKTRTMKISHNTHYMESELEESECKV